MSTNVLVLGAGFGGLELTSRLSETLGTDVSVTLIDKNEAFVFGFNKFDVLFGWKTLEEVRGYYRDIVKPGVAFRHEAVTGIDPDGRRVVTDRGTYDADFLVVALGADYDFAATPGFIEGGSEFYSLDGVSRLREMLPSITRGHVVIAVLGEPFKCPPAPCEAAMLFDNGSPNTANARMSRSAWFRRGAGLSHLLPTGRKPFSTASPNGTSGGLGRRSLLESTP